MKRLRARYRYKRFGYPTKADKDFFMKRRFGTKKPKPGKWDWLYK